MEDQVFATLLRNRGAVRVELSTYRREQSTHVRFYYTDATTGVLMPSPKGVALRRDEVRAVAEALLKAAEVIEAEAAG